jgi:hypothetical protein
MHIDLQNSKFDLRFSFRFSHSMKGPEVKSSNNPQGQEKLSAIHTKVKIEDDKSFRAFMEDMSDESTMTRKKYMSKYLWNTRFVRVTAERPKASSARTMLIDPPEKSQKKKKKMQLKGAPEINIENTEIAVEKIDSTHVRPESRENLSDKIPTSSERSDQVIEISENNEGGEKEELEQEEEVDDDNDNDNEEEEEEEEEEDDDDDEEEEEGGEGGEEEGGGEQYDKNYVEDAAGRNIIDDANDGKILEAADCESKVEEKDDHIQTLITKTQNHNSPSGVDPVNKAEGAASYTEAETKPTSAGHPKRKSVFKTKTLTDEDYRNAGVKTLQKFEVIFL